MDDNREERTGATGAPDGATPDGATPDGAPAAAPARRLTRRELRLAAQAQEASADAAQEHTTPEPSADAAQEHTTPEPSDEHAGRAIGQLARVGPATSPSGVGPLPTASPPWSPVRADGEGAAPRDPSGGPGSVQGRPPAPSAPLPDEARPPLTRRRVREASRDAPAPSVAAPPQARPPAGPPQAPADAASPPATPDPPQRTERETPTSENPAVPGPAAPAPGPDRAVTDPLLSPTLPTTLPEESDVDDVRWDGPVPPTQVVRTPVTRRAVPRVAPPPDDVHATGPVPLVPAPAPAPAPAGSAPAGSAPAFSAGPTWTVRGPADPATPAGPSGTGAVPPAGAAGPWASSADGDVAPVGGVPAPSAVAQAPTEPAPAAPSSAQPGGATLPTLDDLLASRPRPAEGPAEQGWRAVVRRASGGLLALPPGPDEQRVRESVAAVQRRLDGPRTVVVINPKGGAHKTTATLLLAATFGSHRGRSTLAWDNNETRGTLGWRSEHGAHQRTAVDLLDDLHRFEDPTSVRVGDLDAYVRAQSAQFDVLASDEDAASAASIDAFAFRSLHRTLQRFYRVLVVDTGNNMRASNWQAAIEVADQVVVVSTVREDTSQSAAWALDALRAAGKEDAVRQAVTVLADPATRRDAALHERLHDHFGRLTRVVLDVPYDPSLVSGGPLDVDALSRQTREAWLHVAAAVADGL